VSGDAPQRSDLQNLQQVVSRLSEAVILIDSYQARWASNLTAPSHTRMTLVATLPTDRAGEQGKRLH